MKSLRKSVDMLNGDLYSNIFIFALPVMASGIIQLLFNAIDMIVVGKFSGSTSMAAVSSTSSLINLVTNLFIGLSVGSSVAVAKRIGTNNYDAVQKAVHTAMEIAFIAGTFITIIGIVFSKTFLIWMKSPEDVIDLSTLYLRIYFTGMLATFVYNFASGILRAKGDTKRPLFALTVAGALNALLNLFFVVVLKMDVAGVGLASSISSYVSAIIVVVVLMADPGIVRFDIKHMYIDKEALIDIVKVGIPAGIQSTVFSLSNVVIQSSVNEFGSIVMAGNGAASSIANFVYNAMNAFYQTCLTFTSQNIGAGNIIRVKKIIIICLLYVSIVGIVFGNIVYIFGDSLLGIYSDDLEVIASGKVKLLYMCVPYFICGIMDVFVGSLRGMGSSIFPMIVSLTGACAFRLLWVATYFKTHHSIDVLYLSYPISWIITTSIHFLTFLVVYNRIKKKSMHTT